MSPRELAEHWFTNGYQLIDVKAGLYGIMYGTNSTDEKRAYYSEALNLYREMRNNEP